MKFGEVFDYRTVEEAKKYIGKVGVFSDHLREISEDPEALNIVTLANVFVPNTFPFLSERGKGDIFQFFRPVLEDDYELMTHRQLLEWLAKGNGEYTCSDNTIVSTNDGYLKGEEDEPVEDYIIIRRWNDTEWVKPTKAIYEEDCLTNVAINKEDCE